MIEVDRNKKMIRLRIKEMLRGEAPNHGAYTIYAAAPNAKVAEQGRI